jgi:zinc transporter
VSRQDELLRARFELDSTTMRALGSVIVLDGDGGVRAASTIDGPPWEPAPLNAVIVIDAGDPRTADWLGHNTSLSSEERMEYLAPVQRTWAELIERRGEPMLALVLEPIARGDEQASAPAAGRLLLSAQRLIAVLDLNQPTAAWDRARRALDAGKGPNNPTVLFVDLVAAWVTRFSSEATALDRDTFEIEELQAYPGRSDLIDAVHGLRRRATLQRRRVAALRDAVQAVDLAAFPPLGAEESRWHTIIRGIDGMAALLESVIDRVRALDDHLQNRLSAMLNDRLYILTLISAIILPLSFLTGLLGVNIGGIPMRDSPWAFALLCGVLILLGFGQYKIAQRLHWLPRQDLQLRHPRRR